MSTVCAINLSPLEAAWVTATVVPGEPIRILDIHRIPRPALPAALPPGGSGEEEGGAPPLPDGGVGPGNPLGLTQGEPEIGNAGGAPAHPHVTPIETNAEEVVGLIECPRTLYSFLELPFQ